MDRGAYKVVVVKKGKNHIFAVQIAQKRPLMLCIHSSETLSRSFFPPVFGWCYYFFERILNLGKRLVGVCYLEEMYVSLDIIVSKI